MNITILANKDLAANYALNLLLPQIEQHDISLFLSSRVGSAKSAKAQALTELGRQDRQLLEQSGTKQNPKLSFEGLNRYFVQPYEMLDNINKPEGLERFKQTEPDVVISIRYGKILKSPVISLVKQGVLNLHSGVLPDYRGVMATFWAMLNDEQSIGSTLHFIPDSGIDTGDIIDIARMEVNRSKSYQWHVLTLYQQGTRQIADAIDRLSQGKTLVTTTQPQQGNYFSYPQDEDLAKFDAKGLNLFDASEINQLLNEN